MPIRNERLILSICHAYFFLYSLLFCLWSNNYDNCLPSIRPGFNSLHMHFISYSYPNWHWERLNELIESISPIPIRFELWSSLDEYSTVLFRLDVHVPIICLIPLEHACLV